MQILVICRPAEGADPAEFRRLVPAETAALRDLKGSRVLTGSWSPGRPGAVLMLDAPDEAEAARLTATLHSRAARLTGIRAWQYHDRGDFFAGGDFYPQ